MILELSSLSGLFHSASEKAKFMWKNGVKKPTGRGSNRPCLVMTAQLHMRAAICFKPSLGAKEMVPWECTSTSALGISEKQDLLTEIQSAVHLQPIEGGGRSLTQNKHSRLLPSALQREGLAGRGG